MKSPLFAISLTLVVLLCGISAKASNMIYLISSSTEYNEKMIPAIIQTIKAKGYQVNTRYLQQQVSDFGYVQSDAERGQNLVNALLDNNVEYLWFIRGGAGMLNLLPYLEANKAALAKAKPKIIIGFSDVTALHYYLNKQLHWPSIHGVMAAGNRDLYQLISPEIYQPRNNDYLLGMNNSIEELFTSIRDGISYQGVLQLNPLKNSATTRGTLYGGNLELVRSLFSTRFETGYHGDILLLEDIGATPHQLDRMLQQLLFKEDFQPAAIIFGQFYPLSPKTEERLIYKAVIENFARQVNYPVYYYPYFGHGQTNNPLLLCQPVTIICQKKEGQCTLKQPGLDKLPACGQPSSSTDIPPK